MSGSRRGPTSRADRLGPERLATLLCVPVLTLFGLLLLVLARV